jgi:hypothetical protein
MSDKQIVSDLRNIEKKLVKLRKNFKRIDLDYTVQVSISSTNPRKVVYACQMTPPADGLAPITFIADTAEQLMQILDEAIKKFDDKKVEISYHEAQIVASKNNIVRHEEIIAELKGEGEKDGKATEVVGGK